MVAEACPGHPLGAVSGPSENFWKLDDVDDRDKPNDGDAVVILAERASRR